MDKTLLKGLHLLEVLSEMDGKASTIEELSEQIGWTRSNVHRTLQTLMHAGYVVKDRVRGGYRNSTKMFELGAKHLYHLDVRNLAPAFMSKLANLTGDTIHLSILDGIDVVYIDKIDSLQPVRAYSMVGGRAPAYAVATGKALLSAQVDGYLAPCQHQLVKHTEKTILGREPIQTEINKIRKRGYASNDGEWRKGIGGVASVIYDALHRPIAALGISATLDRLSSDRIAEIAPVLVELSSELSEAMGQTSADWQINRQPGENSKSTAALNHRQTA